MVYVSVWGQPKQGLHQSSPWTALLKLIKQDKALANNFDFVSSKKFKNL